MKIDPSILNLVNLKNGAALELFDSALAEVLANVADPNTDAEAKREIIVRVVVGLQKTQVSPIFTLRPMRTFTEAEQPTSDYLIRLRKGSDKAPMAAALFPADGGAWWPVAIYNVSSFLINAMGAAKIERVPILA